MQNSKEFPRKRLDQMRKPRLGIKGLLVRLWRKYMMAQQRHSTATIRLKLSRIGTRNMNQGATTTRLVTEIKAA
ncbi:hypothetical protein CRYUN_Cryun38cG0068800 [Craigia yunnanensis]